MTINMKVKLFYYNSTIKPVAHNAILSAGCWIACMRLCWQTCYLLGWILCLLIMLLTDLLDFHNRIMFFFAWSCVGSLREPIKTQQIRARLCKRSYIKEFFCRCYWMERNMMHIMQLHFSTLYLYCSSNSLLHIYLPDASTSQHERSSSEAKPATWSTTFGSNGAHNSKHAI